MSESHPLRIDPVRVNGVRGQIGLTFCPGTKRALSGSWERNLDLDLGEIESFGAKALVTLMVEHELQDVRVPSSLLQERCLAHGLEWHHLPIRDGSIPDEHFEDQWTYSGLRLRKLLAKGHNIVIHCLGGLGRTGTIAARLLVELGVEPEAAISRVRAARPASIETKEQEEYVQRCAEVEPAGSEPGQPERVLGCLLGGAVGDAFGYCVEFDKLPTIRARFGPAGIQEPVFEDGKLIVSDDTQMTLFTLEGMIKACQAGAPDAALVIDDLRRAYLDWLAAQNYDSGEKADGVQGWLAQQPEMRVRRAPGFTCVGSLRAGGRGTIEQAINNSKGCGGAMRVAPLGLLPHILRPEEVFELAARTAALTHGHPSGYLSAGMVAAIVRFLADGSALTIATQKACEMLTQWKDHEETSKAVAKALDLAQRNFADHLTAVRIIGEGWTGEEALAIALFAALSGRCYVEVVRIAANHDGDSDSTASIAGQLWGAWKGIDEIPHEWITRLDVLAPLLHLGRQAMEKTAPRA